MQRSLVGSEMCIRDRSANQKNASQFWPKSLGKNRNRLFYPSTKNPRELNFGTSGVTFRDERHGNAQKFTAPPNRHFTCFVMTFETLQNLQTAGKSRGWLRFRRSFDENDRNDHNFFFQNFRVAEIFASTKNFRDERARLGTDLDLELFYGNMLGTEVFRYRPGSR